MALLNFLRKGSQPKLFDSLYHPYKDASANTIYNLLFCDDLSLYKASTRQPYQYPFTILFSEKTNEQDVQQIIDDATADVRVKILAYNRLMTINEQPNKKELMAVIVEVGTELGLVVLASFNNGTARYINHEGKVLVWETTTDLTANKITHELFAASQLIVQQIGPWDKARKQSPAKDFARITFLVSDGLYFGEGPTNVLFNDALAKPALNAATQLMQYIIGKI